MELPRIQYITHPDENFEDLSWVHRLHAGGVRWIQLRIKEADVMRRFPQQHYLAFFHEVADRMRAVTSALNMILTINDIAEVAHFSHADGLHIGQEDGYPSEIIFKERFILGATASSESEIDRFRDTSVTYFGLGPLRLTDTKKKLKPVLGQEGYTRLLAHMRTTGLSQPVFAIGGVLPADLPALLKLGVYGLAVSGAIFRTGHTLEAITAFTNETDAYEPENRR